MADPNAQHGVPSSTGAAEALARELYWAAPPIPDARQGARPTVGMTEVVARWSELEAKLRMDNALTLPADEEVLEVGSGLKRWLKRRIFRLTRPMSRRYDRIAADIARLGHETARVGEETAERDRRAATEELGALRSSIDELTSGFRELHNHMEALRVLTHQNDRRLGTTASDLQVLVHRLERTAGVPPPVAHAPAAGADGPAAARPGPTLPELPGEFYWRFESVMRGTAEEIEQKLRQYEAFAVQLREEIGGDPLWVDLGCGEGGFLELLRGWGWRVLGMDISAQAVETCRERGYDAVEGALPEYLLAYEGEAPAALSAIQVIEHLPVETWLPTIRAALSALAPDGALLIETINPLNPMALGSAFFGDVTHTWPANPWTIREMSGFAGFGDIDVRFMNADGNDVAQDYALIARKRA